MNKDDVETRVPVVAGADLEREVAALVARRKAASSGLMRVISKLGGKAEGWMGQLPDGAKAGIEQAATAGLELSYNLAASSQGVADLGASGHKWAAVATGAAGGAGGFALTLAELPATITVMFRGVQSVAKAHGEDPTAADTRLACLEVFSRGGPGEADDGAETGFLSARMGAAQVVPQVIALAAPRLAALFGPKIVAQAVPVAGAVTGAAVNLSLIHISEPTRPY